MSTLSVTEKAKLERLFDMGGGYVSNFSNSGFASFIAETVSVDIYDEKYATRGSSKANRLRVFWEIEDDLVVGKLLKELIEHEAELMHISPYGAEQKKALIDKCRAIQERLLSGDRIDFFMKSVSVPAEAYHMAEQISRMEASISTDPALAIGTAKEFIETCCKTILSERGISFSSAADIPMLTKLTLKSLNLVPDNVPESSKGSDAIKRLLQNLGTIGNNLAELRGLYGTGHGKHANARGLSSRHAKLAVGSAITLVSFLYDTHEEAKKQ